MLKMGTRMFDPWLIIVIYHALACLGRNEVLKKARGLHFKVFLVEASTKEFTTALPHEQFWVVTDKLKPSWSSFQVCFLAVFHFKYKLLCYIFDYQRESSV